MPTGSNTPGRILPGRGTVFVAGTDTGVGKTVLSALWVRHLRDRGVAALGLKPFCTGDRADAEALRSAQGGRASLAAINPFFFRLPLAPWEAARRAGQRVTLARAVAALRRKRGPGACHVVEGCGGLLTPLGDQFTNADLAEALGARVVLVAMNRLGVLNSVLLSLGELRRRALGCVAVVLMEPAQPDASGSSNREVLTAWAEGTPILVFPWLGGSPVAAKKISKNSLRCRNDLETLSALAGVVA